MHAVKALYSHTHKNAHTHLHTQSHIYIYLCVRKVFHHKLERNNKIDGAKLKNRGWLMTERISTWIWVYKCRSWWLHTVGYWSLRTFAISTVEVIKEIWAAKVHRQTFVLTYTRLCKWGQCGRKGKGYNMGRAIYCSSKSRGKDRSMLPGAAL